MAAITREVLVLGDALLEVEHATEPHFLFGDRIGRRRKLFRERLEQKQVALGDLNVAFLLDGGSRRGGRGRLWRLRLATRQTQRESSRTNEAYTKVHEARLGLLQSDCLDVRRLYVALYGT